ncbi:Fur family transcriptional regulator [Crocosphaera sp. XPORK-15E]|uniref:Fur family transcriptional regulator n=1 Tax=Crocosphaera sp. XPORK-15E TaxID=3110247 RepID=UPI002B1FB4F1|nr:Fur family transcriptional regulator [Crocosphaera sp. XPORK-15E]MEA5536351.1 Fur family transcriptional regulator [Crocosphaera sp. XPORK-15E]
MSNKLSKKQQKILEILQQIDSEISAQQLHIELRQQGFKIGLATVYRYLKSLHLEGLVQERIITTGESLYKLIIDSHASEHYHHLNCINCGRSVPLEAVDCPLKKSVHQSSELQKFQIYYHTLEFFGLCDICQPLVNKD